MLRQIRNTTLKTVGTASVVLIAIETTTHLPTEGRSSKTYHRLCDGIGTPLIRRFFSPEDAHNLALELLKRNLSPKFRYSAIERNSIDDITVVPFRRFGGDKEEDDADDDDVVNNNNNVEKDDDEDDGSSKKKEGTTTKKKKNKKKGRKKKELIFPNCIGLAAGFDKDGVVIKPLMDLGFGFVEIGSVTPKPQPGNPKPRMYRLVEDEGIINRFGFNSIGADGVEENLKNFRREQQELLLSSNPEKDNDSTIAIVRDLFRGVLPSSWTQSVDVPVAHPVLGVNLGKNKDSTEETLDYEKGIRQLGPYADYIVINISSPNTPGLRDLQQPDPLRRLLQVAIKERNALPPSLRGNRGLVEDKDIPLLVKIAPDLSKNEMVDIANAIMECDIDGIIISNTSNVRPSLISKHRDEVGGLSGKPIKNKSTETIRTMYALTHGTIPIIGVGGVGSGHDVYEKLKAGASLVQVYTMMVYEGPGLVSKMREELAELMIMNGQRKVEDVIGLDHELIYWKKREERLKRMQRLEKVIVDK